MRVPNGSFLNRRLLDEVTTCHHRYLDRATAAVTQNSILFPNGFFSEGWGDLNTPKRIRRVLQSQRMSNTVILQQGDVKWGQVREMSIAEVALREGTFKSTLANAEQLLPKESLEAFCELITPLEWEQEDAKIPQGITDRPLVVLLPGTGEHGFVHRRTSIAIPLAKEGVATLILEGPFYGKRKPRQQKGSKLQRVSDLPILGQATIEEAKSLLQYFHDYHGFSQMVVAGSSMGGLHAAMVASVFAGDVGATAWLAPPSAAPVFADGLLSGSCNWRSLYKQHELHMLDKMLAGHAVTELYEKQAGDNTDAGKNQAKASVIEMDLVQEAKKPHEVIPIYHRYRQLLTSPDVQTPLSSFTALKMNTLVFAESQWAHMQQAAYRKTILEVVGLLKERDAAAGSLSNASVPDSK
ncbi:unnamed protein product [Peronospora destructor]|uniref:Uncharacterized protein n=1 Tax=Peronospora destructor TaxID=86335 RepID=A0AAV0V469_9STRA|nr:unnamed protein product [Peronospora destructor]